MHSLNLGPEASKALKRRGIDWVYTRGRGLDIGYKGSNNSDPYINCVGLDCGDKDYDGIHIPIDTESTDFVHSSHCLEHIPSENLVEVIQEWYRVIKVGGFIVCTVPHMYLYEMKAQLPSRWNGDHKRFYTPSKLAAEFESALYPNTYRVRSLKDCDEGYTYTSKDTTTHAGGSYEIEIVIEKITPPTWCIV